MEGFTKMAKMRCFKAGGYVKKEEKQMKAGEKADMKEDKKLVKKAFNLHDDQKHEGRTDLSKLKKGGRSAKKPSVRRFQKPEMPAAGLESLTAAAPSAATEVSPAQDIQLKKGGKAKK